MKFFEASSFLFLRCFGVNSGHFDLSSSPHNTQNWICRSSRPNQKHHQVSIVRFRKHESHLFCIYFGKHGDCRRYGCCCGVPSIANWPKPHPRRWCSRRCGRCSRGRRVGLVPMGRCSASTDTAPGSSTECEPDSRPEPQARAPDADGMR